MSSRAIQFCRTPGLRELPYFACPPEWRTEVQCQNHQSDRLFSQNAQLESIKYILLDWILDKTSQNRRFSGKHVTRQSYTGISRGKAPWLAFSLALKRFAALLRQVVGDAK
jgi:hypothetical protein